MKAAVTVKAEEEVFEFANLFLGSRKATNPLLVLLRPPPLDIERGGRHRKEIRIGRKAEKEHKGRKGNRKARPFPDCSSHSFPLGSKSLWIPWKVPASFRDQRPELLNS